MSASHKSKGGGTCGQALRASVLLCALCGSVALSCTIPVFRYALDRWESDKFQLNIPAAVAQQPEMNKLLIPLRGNSPSNVKIGDAADGPQSELYLPHRSDKPIWSGSMDATSLKTILDSPARQDLLTKLLAGDSVIWVIVDNGKPEDDAEAARIEKRLRFLEQVVSLPPQDPNDPDSQLGPGPPLKLHFAMQRVSMKDPAEKIFCAMLAGAKAADALAAGQPFAAAVFGRGRVLGAWPLADLDDAALEDISMFLTGRCSCRVKNENPGWDILMTVDWEKALNGVKKPLGSAQEPPQTAAAHPEVVVTTTHAAAPAPSAPFPARVIGAIAVPAILMAGWLLAKSMRR
jgi:hypothetical protein